MAQTCRRDFASLVRSSPQDIPGEPDATQETAPHASQATAVELGELGEVAESAEVDTWLAELIASELGPSPS